MEDIVFASIISFLVGFKIAAWMSARQIERLKAIWLRKSNDDS